uniref:Sarcosine dehydrogenase, mitochondrial n=1 Tax=Oncorhynchus kisutch TaxID=8019 RepID=A0A8C7JAR7_ONCKI
MAFLGTAVRKVASCRPALSPLCRSATTSRRYSSSSEPTTEKSVPYENVLKVEEGGSGPTKPLPKSAEAVVIGGGSLGCQTVYHLAKMGMTNVVLLERDRLTAGTTWHTAGLLWQLRPSDVEVELLAHTRQVISHDLEQETGLETGWIQNGGLFIASNKQRLDEYKRLMSVIENCPVTGIQVSTDDMGVKRVKAVETLHGTIQTPVVVNCAGVWAAKLGEMAGVKVPLVAMHHAYVVTERIEGIQNMPNVRDHDASVYLRLQGDALSVGGYEQNPVFWDKVSDKFAFSLFDLDWDVFMQHIEGAINRVPALEQTGIKSTVCGPESFTADHKPLMGEAPEVRGFFLGCGFNSAVHGNVFLLLTQNPRTRTDTGVGCTWSEGGGDVGMMLGGGCGRELAHWIIHGRPEKDMYGYDIRRFHHSLTDNNKWIRERSHESYAKNYSVVFPFDEPLASRNMRTDPFHKVLTEQGCVFQERHGWERPGWFNQDGAAPVLDYDWYGAYDISKNQNYKYNELLGKEYTFDYPPHHHVIKNECLTCRHGVSVFNMSYFGKFYLTGPDAKKAADWLFSADVNKIPGSTVYTCMLNKRGGSEADLTVSRLEAGAANLPLAPEGNGDAYYLAIGGGVAEHNWNHIKTVLQDEGLNCQLTDYSEDMGMISIQGPKSREVLQEILDTDLSNEAFPFSTHKVCNAVGHKVRAMRLSFVGELGWELHIPKDSCLPVYQAVMAAGAKHSIINAGYRAIDSLSIEKGYRHWHADLRPDDTPLEAGLAFTCKMKSTIPFLGRASLEKQKAEGLRRRIVCFTIDEKVPMFGLEAIFRNGVPVGHLRRSDYGFFIDKQIGYGYIRNPDGGVVNADFIKSGKFTLERMGVVYEAKPHLKSPFDPSNNRVKGIYPDNYHNVYKANAQ